VKEKVEYKGYKIDFYYTDEEAFSFALTWYDYLKTLEDKAKKEIEELKTASGTTAIELIKKLYQNKQKY
jgi:hypothetical protein